MLAKSTLTALTAVLALGLAAGSTGAVAQTSDVSSVKVSVADVNPSSQAGAQVILRRIHSAAAAVCGPEPSAPIDRMTRFQPCVKEVTNRAVASLNNPLLTALNAGEATSPSTTLASAR